MNKDEVFKVPLMFDSEVLGPAATWSRTCTCRPCTAAGIMVQDPKCPVHGAPDLLFIVRNSIT